MSASSIPLSREACAQRNDEDPLASLRCEFALPEGIIYLDGNSLGARPARSLERAHTVISHEWGSDLIRSWNNAGWFELPLRLGDMLAPLIGAGQGEVAITDTTSVNLFKALAAALDIQHQCAATSSRRVIVSERDNFPTDLYIAQGLSHWLDRGYTLRLVDDPDALSQAITDDVAVVMLTHVNYRSGRLLDMQRLTAHAHAQGALAIWDLAHSAGAVPVDLRGADADFAVGCTYKYLNGGPGAPAYIWVAPQHLAQFSHPLTGWWGHANPFAMQPGFERHPGIQAGLCGTQPIVSLALVECGLETFSRVDMAAVRAKSLAQSDLFIALLDACCAGHGLRLVTPREHAARGSHVSVTHPHGYGIMQALIERGVIGDYREPGLMRFAFTPLYLRYTDVWDAVDILARILQDGAYDAKASRAAVT
ncbi:kynureninase [Pusillimonas sp. TS35]|uniref:kynureninase n=1 Tax=Paracandidimonas lactea TaxID=2895524 RepID=UPI001368A1A5|nr:kynureninase [Paracandidimonas lactea]MYN12015.1 kynureninase [Pusillimonas sp. TS35]